VPLTRLSHRRGWELLASAVGTEAAKAFSTLPDKPIPFQTAIGLPIHPMTNVPHKLMPYQTLYYDECAHKDIVVNKANKGGITETVLREIVWRMTVGDCQGYLVMLGAQDLKLAMENMRRLQNLFLHSPDLARFVKPPMNENLTRTRIELVNGARAMVMPRRAASIRGWERLKFAYLDEAAHYGLLDDEEFLSATTSRLSNTDGYLRIVSTPKGQRGFFHRICVNADTDPKTPWKKFTWDVSNWLGTLVTQDFLDKEKIRLGGDLYAQEYLCKFITTQSSAYPTDVIDSTREDYQVVEG
jgi:terminase large subunit-like protein